MSAETADRLRALARDHLEGRMGLQSYRRLRAELLDDLVAPGTVASSVATQPRAAAQIAEVTQPRAAAARPATSTAAQAAAAASPAGEPRSGRIAAIAALGLVVAFAVVLLLWRHHPRGPASPPEAAARGGGQTDPIQALLEPLLQNPDWSDARLLALNEALLEAGRPRLEAVRSTEWFDAFLASVRSRLRQQQALAGAPLTPDNSPLAALAVTLGIDLAAPSGPVSSDGQGEGEARGPLSGESAAQSKRLSGGTGRTGRAGSTGRGGSAGSAAAPGAVAPGAARGKSESPGFARDQPRSTEPTATGTANARQPAAAARRAAEAPPAAAQPVSMPASRPVSATAPAVAQHSSASAAHREFPACSAALSQARLNYCRDVLASGDPGPLLAVIPAGSFVMGNNDSPAEAPAHRVTLARAFAMSVYEVSQSEFQLYCRASGKSCPRQPWTGGDYPEVDVSWGDAQDYARWLSRETHQRYRLPSEAEWEYAARAGRTGLYPSGDALSPTDAYFSVGPTLTAPARRSMPFNANAWHLMHMLGNVREWVEDAWNPTFAGAASDGSARLQGEAGIKVVRGGCYSDQAIKLRLTTREPLPADSRDRCTGIRVLREVSP